MLSYRVNYLLNFNKLLIVILINKYLPIQKCLMIKEIKLSKFMSKPIIYYYLLENLNFKNKDF